MTGKILGTGAYVPETIWNNSKLEELVETNDEWIRERTGICERHIAEEIEPSAMAIEAAKRAMKDWKAHYASMAPADIDAIFVCTTTSDRVAPTISCMVQKEIGAVNAFCYDMNAACAGFVFAYNMAVSYMNSGLIRTALIVGSEKLSKIVNWEDRGSCILFGDGAGAMVVTATEGPGEMVMHSEGAKGEALECETGAKLSMDGQKVFKFAVKSVPMAITELLGKLRMSKNDIDWYILHQANMRIIESVSKRLDISMDKIPCNIAKMGNTSSASVGILLDEARKNGKIKNGDKIIISGFGAGLTWGAGYIIG